MRRIKFIAIALLVCYTISNCFAQVNVSTLTNQKVSDLVQKYLVGPNIELIVDSAHKATFNGKEVIATDAIGSFVNLDTTGMNMPMDEGLVLVTGKCTDAGRWKPGIGGNQSPSVQNDDTSQVLGFFYQYYKYCQENGRTAQKMRDIASLVFWIKPKINNFAFTYSFASKEYPGNVGKSVNDFFGFFFSGPYDAQGNIVEGSTHYEMQNIALVPGTNTAVMLNSINGGNPNYPSRTNPTPPSNPQYYRQNPLYGTGSFNTNANNCFMNGYTSKLSTELVNVVADLYYKIEIDICDISDNAVNSAVYLSRDLRRFDTISIDTVICDNQEYYFDKLDSVITESGTYRYTEQNETGGDVYTIVNITVNPTDYVSQCWSLVKGESVEMNGITIADTGMYITHLETSLGCDSTVVLNVYWGDAIQEIDCPSSSLAEDIVEDNIKLYPNPTKGILNIDGIAYDTYLEFYDNNGRMMKSLRTDINNIDISDLPDGIYYVRIKSNDHFIVKRIIKE
ncbi:MAG: T9SS type A sorting domain-containing protein [Bacteroidales bacterium]|nr:T9SS type A sorting domain-containing protein [Bacteroidales bacterium]